jgi:SAM-dependent methyltransferase
MFDKVYFETGLRTGYSCYENYSWHPEISFPLVDAYIDYLKIKKNQWILDYGCAKGFVVKAFRERGYAAWGCDISSYAILHTEDEIKPFLTISTKEDPVPWAGTFDWIIAKDVFEHLTKEEVKYTLDTFVNHSLGGTKVFLIVPLAKYSNGPYMIAQSEQDRTHIIREDLYGWIELLENSSWKVTTAVDFIKGINEKHTKQRSTAGFFILEQKY